MSGFPQSPGGAFSQASFMSDKLGLSLIEFVHKAKQIPSTVYRWRTNKRSYDVTVFLSLVKYFEAEMKRRKKSKARPS